MMFQWDDVVYVHQLVGRKDLNNRCHVDQGQATRGYTAQMTADNGLDLCWQTGAHSR